MAQANRVAVYAHSGVEEYNNGNFEAINTDLKQAIECVKSYNEHTKQVFKILTLNLHQIVIQSIFL